MIGMIGLLIVAFGAVLSLVQLSAWIGIPIAVSAGIFMLWAIWTDPRRKGSASTFSDPGTSIEVDCRGCGQFNRVPSHRLRDRPKCGRCKARLMPGKHLVVCRVSPLDAALSRELDGVWKDEDRLWQSLADYVTITDKARKEARGESDRVVN